MVAWAQDCRQRQMVIKRELILCDEKTFPFCILKSEHFTHSSSGQVPEKDRLKGVSTSGSYAAVVKWQRMTLRSQMGGQNQEDWSATI